MSRRVWPREWPKVAGAAARQRAAVNQGAGFVAPVGLRAHPLTPPDCSPRQVDRAAKRAEAKIARSQARVVQRRDAKAARRERKGALAA